MKSKVEGLGKEAQKYAIRLYAEGLTAGAITDKLNEKFKSELSVQNMRSFLKRKKHKSFQILKEERNFDQKMAKTYFDTLKQLNTLNSEMWEFFYEIRKDPEYSSKQVFCPECSHKFRVQLKAYGMLLKSADHLLKQIDHVDKVLGKLNENHLKVEYNVVNLSQNLVKVIPQLFHNAERQGIIKILKKKRLKEL